MPRYSMTLPTSRKMCSRDSMADELFFSLMDYRNNLFMSNDFEDVIRFYDSFQNRDDLIQWMKERPRGATYIHEVEGNKDIVVVIPTADFNGRYAEECRKNIFNGLHIIFIESGEIPDPYFNYAHSCNAGVKKALEYDPKWIVISNDDMYKIDDVEVLRSGLMKLDEKKYDFTVPPLKGGQPLELSMGRKKLTYDFYRVFKDRPIGHLYNKFNIRYFYIVNSIKRSAFVFEKVTGTTFVSFRAFIIFSAVYLRNEMGGNPFDDVYINEHEDLDLSFRLFLNRARTFSIRYRVGARKGSSLGMTKQRGFRQICGRAYFNFKYEKMLDYLRQRRLL